MSTLLVLDLDDTLYPERDYVMSGFASVGRWLERALGVVGFAGRASEAFNAGTRGNTFDLVLSDMGVVTTPELIATLVGIYRSHSPRIALYQDAEWCLQHVGRGVDLGLLTDGYLNGQQSKVNALGIASRFRTIVYSDELGRESWKPSRTPYLEMMRRTGYSGPDCVYVADNPEKDFLPARELGWMTIRIRRPDGIHATLEPAPGYEPHLEVDTLILLDAAIAACRDGAARMNPVGTGLFPSVSGNHPANLP